MARRKLPNMHTRKAREIAGDPGLSRPQKKRAIMDRHKERMGAGTAPGPVPSAMNVRQKTQLAHRIGVARAGILADHIRAVRSTQQAQMHSRLAGARLGAPQPAPKVGLRSLGREKAGQFSNLGGGLSPVPSSRKDVLKIPPSLGRQPTFGAGMPIGRGMRIQ